MWLQTAAYYALRSAVAIPQTAGLQVSLRAAAAAGKAYALFPANRRRLRRALDHIAVAFPEWSDEDRLDCAIAAFQHAFMLGIEVAFTPRVITEHSWRKHIEYTDAGPSLRALTERKNIILLTGHCGNWEMLGAALTMLGYPLHAVYRPLDLKPLDAWLRRSRDRAGMTLVDKFGAVKALPAIFDNGYPVSFVADQNGGDRGIFVPFFGRLVSSYKSIALSALQYQATVVIGQARRIGWRGGRPETFDEAERQRHRAAEGFRFKVEVADVIGPEDYMPQPDPAFYLTARYRLAIEHMIRACPWDYFWMHRSWRSRPHHERRGRPFPDSLRQKLESLPWMTQAELEKIIARSDEDRATLQRLGVERLP